MAWEARSGLKQNILPGSSNAYNRLNGLGSPFGIETLHVIKQPLDGQMG